MTIEEFIEAAKKSVVTEEDVKTFQATLKKTEKRLEQEARSQAAGQAFLARTYSL